MQETSVFEGEVAITWIWQNLQGRRNCYLGNHPWDANCIWAKPSLRLLWRFPKDSPRAPQGRTTAQQGNVQRLQNDLSIWCLGGPGMGMGSQGGRGRGDAARLRSSDRLELRLAPSSVLLAGLEAAQAETAG